MKFQMPETLEGLSLDEVSKLLDAAHAEALELNKIADDKITEDESRDLIELVGHMDTLAARKDELEADAAPTAEELAAARARFAKDDDPADDADDKGDDDADDKGDDDPESEPADEKEKEAVLASAGVGKRTFAARVARTTDAAPDKDGDDPDAAFKSKAFSITASANIKGFESGQEIDSYAQLAIAYAERSRAFAGGGSMGRRKALSRKTKAANHLSKNAQRFSVATLTKPTNQFSIAEKASRESAYETLMAAASEGRLQGGSLIAAGGWCSPSQQVYGFLELESADGLLDVPEVNAPRGGIQYTKGPQLGDLLLEANLGFVQTETEAEAGEVKPVYDIECPDWDEVRMDAVGYALRAGLLTNATFPELLRRYLSLATIVHARRMNALTISRISTLIGAATTFAPVASPTGVYSSTSDLLGAIELGALRIREQYSMPLGSTVEGVFPLWAPTVIRAELSRRGDRDLLSVTDAEISAWFTARKVKPQFVRDYQGINAGAANTAGGTGTWTRLPDKVEFMLYPAGSFVRLATDVIDLDTVYDTDDLTQNQFMAAFFEEGFGIANTGASGVKYSVGTNNIYGVTGGHIIGDASAVAPV